jgi:two-component system, OmpR family, sensor histidine kinase ChvG
MALDSRSATPLEPVAGSREFLGRVRRVLQAAAGACVPLLRGAGRRIGDSAIARFFSSSLWRRIFVSNLIGLFILLGGYVYLTQSRVWLIDAKRESLKTQGETIAAAIAANATAENERITLDPDALVGTEGAKIPFRDDGFSALELSIRPQKVTPVLRRMVPAANRARIYGRDGTLVADSAQLLSRGQIARAERGEVDDTSGERPPKTKNLLTRVIEFFSRSDLPVYKEIGSANGMLYPEVRMAMTGTPAQMLLLTENREQIVSVAVPIQRARAVQGVLLLSTQPGDIDDILAQEYGVIMKVALLALAATIAASLLLAKTVAGPMHRLSEAAEQVSKSISARRNLPELSGRTDEIGQLAAAFARMTGALYGRIEASEKFAADVAHELKNPLTAARSTAESLVYAKSEEQRLQLVQQIQSELKRLNRLITDVSNASRLDAELALQQTERLDLTGVLSGIVETFRDILNEDGRRIVLEIAPPKRPTDYVIHGNEGRLGQVVTNLLDNALSFSPEDGTVTVRVRHQADHIELSVEDEGPGIEPDKLEQIFERFYTYRPTATSSRGSNSGLGLSISREIVRAHGGEIWAENRTRAEGRGARLCVRLPTGTGRRAQARNTDSRGRRA